MLYNLKKIFKLNFIAASLIFIGCSKEHINGGVDLNLHVDFSIKGEDGVDKLSPKSTNTLNTDKIKIFNKIGEEVKLAYDATKSYPKFYHIFQDGPSYRMRVFLNYISDERSISYIQWNENNIDTLEVEYSRLNNILNVKSLWLNGDLKFQSNNSINDVIEIIK